MSKTFAHDLTLRDSDLDDIGGLLSIPSVSADPAYASAVRAAAQWMCERSARAGLEHIRILETPGHPSISADWLHAPGRPTVLVMGTSTCSPFPMRVRGRAIRSNRISAMGVCMDVARRT